jgi:hypothetical protein
MSSPQELFLLHRARQVFVVMVRDKHGNPTLLFDPGMDRPWSSTNKKLADFQASACGGETHTVESAWSILLRENPLFEQQLVKQIVSRQQINFPTKESSTNGNTDSLFDANGNPIV